MPNSPPSTAPATAKNSNNNTLRISYNLYDDKKSTKK